MVEGVNVGQQWLVLLPLRRRKRPQVALAQGVVSLLARPDGVAGPLATSLPTPQRKFNQTSLAHDALLKACTRPQRARPITKSFGQGPGCALEEHGFRNHDGSRDPCLWHVGLWHIAAPAGRQLPQAQCPSTRRQLQSRGLTPGGAQRRQPLCLRSWRTEKQGPPQPGCPPHCCPLLQLCLRLSQRSWAAGSYASAWSVWRALSRQIFWQHPPPRACAIALSHPADPS